MSACTSASRSSDRSERRRRAALRLTAPLLGLLVASLALPSQQATEAQTLMNRLSQRFRGLDQNLHDGDLVGAAALADELRGLLVEPPPFEPGDAAEGEVLAAQLARLDDAAAELGALAAQGNLLGAGQAFEELRASCVSCHVLTRSDNELRGNFPARENTVSGRVELLDADGEPRADRAWVLVFLEGAAREPTWVHARANPRISQHGRRFEPRVLPVTVGTTIEFPNDDTIFHNVFSLSKTAPFDLGVYEPGQSASVLMQRTGLVKVYCNIHPEMAASIVVLENPCFALTDGQGRFVICGVPDGEYVLRGWNDMGAEARKPLEVRGGRLLETSLELRETARSLSHDNKYGRPYSGKYR